MSAREFLSGSAALGMNVETALGGIISQAGTYQLVVDLAALAGTDVVEIRVYGRARAGDTERLEDSFTFAGTRGRPLMRTIPYVSPHHVRFTARQTAGVGRVVNWSVYATS